MFNFGIRKITKQGGSFLIFLPMERMKDTGIDLEAVKIEMDSDKSDLPLLINLIDKLG